MKNRDLMLIAAGVAAIWVIQQNQAYRTQAERIGAAAVPIGHLASTVDTYVPMFANAFDYWAHKD